MSATTKAISQIELKKHLSYNPLTGSFKWIKPPKKGNRMIGGIAGHLHGRGYIYVEISGRQYAAHRLAWLYMTGEWPPDQIDHRNMNKADNRWQNIRPATKAQNHANRKVSRNNLAGAKGIRFDARRSKWQARITLNYKQKSLGSFDTKEAAQEAYKAAATKFFGEFGREA